MNLKNVFVIFLILSCFTLSPSFSAKAESTPPEAAREYMTGTVEELPEGADGCLWDNDRMTFYKADNINISVSCEKEFRAVYLIWNTPPKKYTVSREYGITDVNDGFLHKLVEFDAPVGGFTLKCESGGELCDIFLIEDDIPDFVQKWKPPCERADILLLSAHADDEFLMFGGTIPYYAKELGLQVQVVYLTAHYKEQPRPHELLNGLWTAGLRNYPITGIIDDIPRMPIYSLEEAERLYDPDAVLEWFAEQIRVFKPSVIVTHDIDGEYGHGAHMLAAKTVMDAVEISGDAESFPVSAEKYGVWDVPKTYLHLWEENAITMDWERALPSFGGITAREAAQLAYSEHKSQQKWNMAVCYAPKWDCRRFGLYRTTVGADEVPDFIDHIEPVKDTPPTENSEPNGDNSSENEEPESSEISSYSADQYSDSSEYPASAETSFSKPAENNAKSSFPVIPAAIGAVLTAAAAAAVAAYVKKRK